jgi:hypothetical protein
MRPSRRTRAAALPVSTASCLTQNRTHQHRVPCSVWKSRLWLHSRNQPAFIWSPGRPRWRGRMRALLQNYWHQGPVLTALYWSILQHSRKGHRSMPLSRRRELVRSVALPPSQPIRRACAVSDCALPHSFLCLSLWRLTEPCCSFDLCEESGAYDAFFPKPRGALSGHYEEVSCSEWSGWDGPDLWNSACLTGESTGLWPSVGCGNTGMKLSISLCREKCGSYTL